MLRVWEESVCEGVVIEALGIVAAEGRIREEI